MNFSLNRDHGKNDPPYFFYKGEEMKHINFFQSILIIGFCFVFWGFSDCSFADVATTEVDIITTSHPTAMTNTTISVSFQYTETTHTDFYYTITTLSSYTITNDLILEGCCFRLAKDANATSGDGPYSDDDYYLYIAAYKNEMIGPNTVGPTTKVGPLTVDTQAPNFVTVDGPASTQTSKVSLTINSNEDINRICISETGFGNCVWEPLVSENYDYTLPNEGDHLLYVQAKDIAGNMVQASAPFSVTYTSVGTSKSHSIPTVSEWGMIIFSGLLLAAGCYSIRLSRKRNVFVKLMG